MEEVKFNKTEKGINMLWREKEEPYCWCGNKHLNRIHWQSHQNMFKEFSGIIDNIFNKLENQVTERKEQEAINLLKK